MSRSSTAAVFFYQWLWIFLIITFVFNLPSQASSEISISSDSHAMVKNLWVDSSSDNKGFIISILLSSSVPVQTSTTSHPYRLTIVLPHTSLVPTFPKHPRNLFKESSQANFTVTDYHVQNLSSKQTNLTFTFSKPFLLRSTDNLSGPHGTTLLLTVVEDEKASTTTPFLAQPTSLPDISRNALHHTKKPLIILDPGHGGGDSGAKTKSGVQEKFIVLKIAHQLKQVLERSGTIDVALTRSTDVFIPLAARVRMARDRSASLFISLHADALPSTSSVNGLTVYTLSSVASDRESERLAEHENTSAFAGEGHDESESEEINNILMDFTTRETRMLSIAFSEKLIEQWRGEFSLNKTPLRSANFLVLKAPDVPSVLIELAYLSNEEDLKRLSSDHWQKQFCARVEQAVHSYLGEKQLIVSH